MPPPQLVAGAGVGADAGADAGGEGHEVEASTFFHAAAYAVPTSPTVVGVQPSAFGSLRAAASSLLDSAQSERAVVLLKIRDRFLVFRELSSRC